MIPLLLISGSIITSGFLGGLIGYNSCLCQRQRKKNNSNKKNVSFNATCDYENNNSSLLKSPSLSSPELYKDYEKISDKKL